MMVLRKKGKPFWSVVLTLGLIFGALESQMASAKEANVKNYTLSGSCKSIRSNESSFLYHYKKITFQGNKVTFQGNILLIPSGKGKARVVKKLTLKLASNCKFYDSDGEDTLTPANKKKKIKQYQKLNFYALMVTVKNEKVVRFVDGRYD